MREREREAGNGKWFAMIFSDNNNNYFFRGKYAISIILYVNAYIFL